MKHPRKDAAPKLGAKLNGTNRVRTARNSSVECNYPRTPENGKEIPERLRTEGEAVTAQASENAAKRVRTALTGGDLAVSRIRTAEAFVQTLDELFDEGHDGYSLRALAERYVHIDEKAVRRWCPDGDGVPEKPMPLAALPLLPRAVAKRMLAKLFPGGLP